MIRVHDFEYFCHSLDEKFLSAKPLPPSQWQSKDVSDKPEMATRELLNFSFEMEIPVWGIDLARAVNANLPWAEDHFKERVSGEPLNPPPSNEWWPYAQAGNADHKSGKIFSHTYPERMWPKDAGWDSDEGVIPHRGIRYLYGDLEDVVQQLKKDPATRQAFLPIWFPEDTGATHGERVPCTLGYHFLIRDRKLQITYYIRSCDYMRHFRDDVYMAGRLAQWMVDRYNEDAPFHDIIQVDKLVMHMVSFHIFEGDVPVIWKRFEKQKNLMSERLMRLL